MKKLKYILTLLFFITLPIIGNAQADNTTLALAQGTCPVMIGNPVNDSLYVDYQGERIFFCCKPCVETFTENPGKYLGNLPQFEEAEIAHEQGESHDHATDHGETAKTSRLISSLGKFHPVAVHLPIALVLGAALAELLFMLTWNFLFRNVAIFNLLMAVLGAVATVPLGLAAASGARYPEEYQQALYIHKWLGIAVLLLTIATAALAGWANRKAAGRSDQWPYRLALLTCVVLVGTTGHYGGLLVYGLNHFSW